MKFHLPVKLFRALIAVVMVSSSWAATTVLTEDTKLTPTEVIMTTSSDSVSYTSADSADKKDLIISGATTQIFQLGKEKSLTFDWLETVSLIDNMATTPEAGIIVTTKDANARISMMNNGSVILDNNDTVSTGSNMYGGVLCARASDVLINNNGVVSISDNDFTTSKTSNSNTYGGAVYVTGACTFSISNNGSVDISDNSLTSKATAHGGAVDIGQIDSEENVLVWNANGNIMLSGNVASGKQARGGAMHAKSRGEISGTTGTLSFINNTASSSNSTAFGGAISLEGHGHIALKNNNIIEFKGNRSEGVGYTYNDPAAGGAALHGISGTSYTFEGNSEVNFIGNIASNIKGMAIGGAIYATSSGSEVLFTGNDTVAFSGNGLEVVYGSFTKPDGSYSSTSFADMSGENSYAFGGAIYSQGGVSFRDNGSVVFEKNFERSANEDNEFIRLRSIYVKAYGNPQHSQYKYNLNLSARDGGSITFRDSISVSGSLIINEAYEGKSQNGIVMFSGATTEADLNAIIAAYTPEGTTVRTATAEEIRLSRTSDVRGAITLNNGVLSVQGGAMLIASSVELKAGTILSLEGIDAAKVDANTIAALTTSSLSLGEGAKVELCFSADYLKSTQGGNFKMLVADFGEGSNIEVASTQLTSGSVVWQSSGLTWTMEDGLAYISGSLTRVTDIVINDKILVSEDISDAGNEAVSLTISDETTTITGNNSYSGGTTIVDSSVILGSASALGSGDVVVSGTSSISTTRGVALEVEGDLTNKGTLSLDGDFIISKAIVNNGSLLLDGTVDASALNKQAEEETYVCVEGKAGDNGFKRDAGSFIQMVENGESGIVSASESFKVTHDGTDYILDPESGKAYAHGQVHYGVYYINTGDHEVSVSDLATASSNSAEKVKMIAGTLLVDASTTVDVEDSSTLKLTGKDVKLTGEIDGESTSLQVTGSGTIEGDNSYSGGTVIDGGKLTVASDKALGMGDVVLKNHGTLDLGGRAVSNYINVEGCTLAGAGAYSGNMDVSGDLLLQDATTAAKVVMVGGGKISGAPLTTTALDVQTEENAFIGGDLTINNNGTVTLNDGKVLVVGGSLTLDGATTLALSGDYAVGDKLLTGTGTLTLGDVTLVYDDSTVELAQQGNSLVLVSKFKQERADVLAQGNWGIATASRAFVNTVRGQHSNTGRIADGRGTAWAAAFGAFHDLDGSDIDVKGAAVGLDAQVGAASTVGIAVGYTDGEVQPAGLRGVDQEGTYVALYGEHGLKKLSPTSCLSLDWVAAYGNTESEVDGTDWEQDSLQLNTRLNWNRKVTDRLGMSVFGGLEYFASESDTVDGVKTGSIRNLRGEIGVGVRYVAWGTPANEAVPDEKGATIAVARPGCEKLVLHGELRYMNDMVRSNPVIRMNGLSGDGENPGRQGFGIEAGATYRIGERWSASANYGYNAMEDSREHRVNVGASYTF